MDIEKQVLAEIMLTDKDKQLDCLNELGLKDFQNEKWQRLFKVFCEIIATGKQIEILEVYRRTKEFMDGAEISALTLDITSDAFLSQHILQLKEYTYKRELNKSLNTNMKLLKDSQCLEETEEAKNKIISELSSISVGDVSRFINFNEFREKIFNNIEKNDKHIEGHSWGITELDAYTSGIVIPRLYILGGLKKGGKSRFVINQIKNLSLQGVKNVFLSLEMPAYEVVKLLHSAFSGVEDTKLRSKTFISNEEKEKVKSAFIPKQYFDVEEGHSLTIQGIMSRLRRYAKQGYEVVFIDYLQRIKHDRNKQVQELEEICNSIADATRAYNIAIILLSQLQNIAERETPTVGHLKGSGGIAESADVIMMFDNLYRRTKKESDKNLIDIHIEQRYGDSGVIHLISDLGTCFIGDLVSEQHKQMAEAD